MVTCVVTCVVTCADMFVLDLRSEEENEILNWDLSTFVLFIVIELLTICYMLCSLSCAGHTSTYLQFSLKIKVVIKFHEPKI